MTRAIVVCLTCTPNACLPESEGVYIRQTTSAHVIINICLSCVCKKLSKRCKTHNHN